MQRPLFRVFLGVLLGTALALSAAIAFAQDVTVTLSPVAGSGVSATATLSAVGNQTTITVTATGLAAGSSHSFQVNFGTCANTGGDAFVLPTLVAGANGTATVSTTINATLASLQDGNHLLHIHQSIPPNDGPVVACGDIPMAAAVATATPAATAAATATPMATAAATATRVVTATASPAALPSAGGPSDPGALPLVLGILGLSLVGFAAFLSRRPATNQ